MIFEAMDVKKAGHDLLQNNHFLPGAKKLDTGG